jgi:hypothetical protein
VSEEERGEIVFEMVDRRRFTKVVSADAASAANEIIRQEGPWIAIDDSTWINRAHVVSMRVNPSPASFRAS